MAELKTKKTEASAEAFLNAIEDINKRDDSFILLEIFKRVTKEQPKMWGSSIIGFGQYHYKSERSRQEGDWPLVAFSPRKQNLTLYIINGFENMQELLSKLGKNKTSVGCLYIKKLSDVNIDVLEEIVAKSFEEMKRIYK